MTYCKQTARRKNSFLISNCNISSYDESIVTLSRFGKVKAFPGCQTGSHNNLIFHLL